VIERIVVAIDGSEDADHALTVAADIAGRYHATLTLLAVVPVTIIPYAGGPMVEPPSRESMNAIYDDVLSTRRARIQNPNIPRVETVRREGIVVEELLAYLDQEKPDLLVMGSRGLSTGKRLLLGSVSDAVVHHAKCRVLVVRPGS